MNPMCDKSYRDWRANELSREIAREAQIAAARERRPDDSNSQFPTFMQKLSLQITMIWTDARKKPRHDQPTTHRKASIAANSKSAG